LSIIAHLDLFPRSDAVWRLSPSRPMSVFSDPCVQRASRTSPGWAHSPGSRTLFPAEERLSKPCAADSLSNTQRLKGRWIAPQVRGDSSGIRIWDGTDVASAPRGLGLFHPSAPKDEHLVRNGVNVHSRLRAPRVSPRTVSCTGRFSPLRGRRQRRDLWGAQHPDHRPPPAPDTRRSPDDTTSGSSCPASVQNSTSRRPHSPPTTPSSSHGPIRLRRSVTSTNADGNGVELSSCCLSRLEGCVSAGGA